MAILPPEKQRNPMDSCATRTEMPPSFSAHLHHHHRGKWPRHYYFGQEQLKANITLVDDKLSQVFERKSLEKISQKDSTRN